MEPIVPIQLDTERLILRQFREDDWRGLYEYYSNQEATKFTFGRVLNEGDTWRVMCGMIGHWQVRGYGPYAVEEKQSGKVAGTVGFWYPLDWPSPEIKWGLAPDYWGKGYASEAARAVHAAGKQHLPDTRLISLIHTTNHASIRVAEALGATYEKPFVLDGEDCHIYRHR